MSQYWYCVRHHRVEPEAGCRSVHRLGPYDSEAAAARALDRVEERNEEWDTDPRWNDDVPEEPGGAGPQDRPSR